jgi:SAM-dependent methyltransferase
MSNLYDENYFERGEKGGVSLYENYRWLPELTIPFAFRIIEELNIKKDDKILDFGCAKGYLVKAFRLLYRNAFGIDISEYAVRYAPQDINNYVACTSSVIAFCNKYDWIISKDTLEHIDYEDIDSTLFLLKEATKNMFCIIPLGDGNKYNIDEYNKDITHRIGESLDWWKRRFLKAGFKIKKATYHMEHMKENWYKINPQGNGFFILKSRK